MSACGRPRGAGRRGIFSVKLAGVTSSGAASNRIEEHLAVALFNYGALMPPDERLALVDYEAVIHCGNAAHTACRAIKDFLPFGDVIGRDLDRYRDVKALAKVLENREDVISFLIAEERVLKEAGLAPTLVAMVIARCIDFLERKPEELEFETVRQAFAAAEYRVCDDARERLEAMAAQDDTRASAFVWRINGRSAMRAAIGITIIGANYAAFGLAEAYGQLSSGYGLAWLPTWSK